MLKLGRNSDPGFRGQSRSARSQVDEHTRQEPRRDPAVSPLPANVFLSQDARQAPDRRADEDTSARWIDAFDSRIDPRLARSGDPEDDVSPHPARVLRSDHRCRLEAFDLGADSDHEVACVERPDPVNAAASDNCDLPG